MYQFFRTVFIRFILFPLIISSPLYAQQKLEEIVAVVGDEIILESEVQEILNNNRTHRKISPGDNCKFFEEMLKDQLILHFAKKDATIRINDEQLQLQVEKNIKNFKKQYGSEKALLKFYGRTNLDEIRQDITTMMKNREYFEQKRQKIIEERIIDPSPKQVRDFYERNKENFAEIPKEFELSEIIFPIRITETHRKKIIDQLKKIKEDILQGESFATKAIAYSEDLSSAIEGGLIEGAERAKMLEEFQTRISSMKEGEICEPFETELGFHLLQLENNNGEEVDIRHILLIPKYTEKEIENTKALANSVSKLLKSGKITFEEALKRYCNNKTVQGGPIKNIETGTNHFQKSQLPIVTLAHITNLQEGSTSDVYEEERDGRKVYVIIKLIKDIPPRKISFLQDYKQIKYIVVHNQEEEILGNWIHKHLDKVFIKIGKNYQNCLFKNNWLKK